MATGISIEHCHEPFLPYFYQSVSITERWHQNGLAVFEQFYEPLNVSNYGIGGDRTQWLQWRIRNGEVQGLSPKVVVLKIGTNNVGNVTGKISNFFKSYK